MSFLDPEEDEPKTPIEMLRKKRWYRFLQAHRLIIHTVITLGLFGSWLVTGKVVSVPVFVFLCLFGLMYEFVRDPHDG
jgi:hypothetical protein